MPASDGLSQNPPRLHQRLCALLCPPRPPTQASRPPKNPRLRPFAPRPSALGVRTRMAGAVGGGGTPMSTPGPSRFHDGLQWFGKKGQRAKRVRGSWLSEFSLSAAEKRRPYLPSLERSPVGPYLRYPPVGHRMVGAGLGPAPHRVSPHRARTSETRLSSWPSTQQSHLGLSRGHPSAHPFFQEVLSR